jgi:hypothetical protein
MYTFVELNTEEVANENIKHNWKTQHKSTEEHEHV